MKNVCVQGLGFVGAAIAVALANVKDTIGAPVFNVTGIDLENSAGKYRTGLLSQGIFPFPSNDNELKKATQQAILYGNLKAVFDLSSYQEADYIIVSLPFNLTGIKNGKRAFLWDDFKDSIKQFARIMKPECLVIVETTVPPGTCRNVVLPIIQEEFAKRNIHSTPLLAHSYERVMPGDNYLHSIIEFYRCYAGLNEASANLCKKLLEQLINIKKYPLTKLATLEASEIAKVLENSYRAVTIAFMEEWAEFAEKLNVNLYEVISAIRMRPTHSNIRQPGFGVGGYCLTKDPLFAQQAAREIYNLNNFNFPFCELAVKTNNNMPKRCFKQLKNILGNLNNKKILLFGVSYKSDVGDTRLSPSELFVQEAKQYGADVTCHDPFVSHWEEMNINIEKDLSKFDFGMFDALVIAVPHTEYKQLDFNQITKNTKVLIFDACGLLDDNQIEKLKQKSHRIFIIGRGEI